MSDPTLSPRGRLAERKSPTRFGIAVQIVGAIVIALLVALFLAYWARSTSPKGQSGAGARAERGSGGRPAVTVGIAKATLGSIPVQLDALGTVTAVATVNITARVSGTLDLVAFREGQWVRRGQVLAQIDPRPFTIALQQAQAQLLHDTALLRNAAADLARYRALLAQDSIARQQVDAQVALVGQYEATLASDRAGVANARLNLSFTRITSPVAGRVGLRQIDPGNQIAANATTPITVVAQVEPIDVVFAVPETSVATVASHMSVGHLQVTAFDRAGGLALAHGTLTALDSVIDTSTGTLKAKARFSNADHRLFPNQFVSVRLLVEVMENQIIVPTSAVRHGPQGDFVWVLEADATVNQRLVATGSATAETVSISHGLAVGEVVISDGGDRLKEGAKVVLPGASTKSPNLDGRRLQHHRRGDRP